MLHSLFQIKSARPSSAASTRTVENVPIPLQEPTRPAKAVPRSYPAVPQKDEDDGWAAGKSRMSSVQVFEAQDDLEKSRPTTPVEGETSDTDRQSHNGDLGSDGEADGVEALTSMWYPHMNKFRLLTLCLMYLSYGLNDSAAGALLPYIERHYNIGYAMVSLIFVGTAVGSIVAAVFVDPMKRRLGYARSICLCQVILALGYIPMLTMRAPFAAIIVGFFFYGFTESINVAMGNTFCASLRETTVTLGMIHGSYGIGGISGPLIATSVVVTSGADTDTAINAASVYGNYYFVPFAFAVLTAVGSAWSFAGYERDIDNAGAHTDRMDAAAAAAKNALHLRRWRERRQRPDEHKGKDKVAGADSQRPQDFVTPLEPVSFSSTVASRVPLEPASFSSTVASRVPLEPISYPSTVASRVPSRAASPELVPVMSRPMLSPLQSTEPTPMPSYSSTAPLVSPHATAAGASAMPAVSEMTLPATAMASGRDFVYPGTDRRASLADVADLAYVDGRRTRPASPSGARPPRRQHRRRLVPEFLDTFSPQTVRVVLIGALFIFAYQGSEVSIAGWVTSFLIADRHGQEPAVGYTTAGFWAGITLGRFLLAGLAQRIGERRFVFGCVAGSAVFEVLVWVVPNIIGDAVAVSVVGLLLGPIYPCAASVFMRSMSRRERIAGIGIIAAFGSAGGAAAPFLTGILAQVAGTFVLHPLVIGLFVLMLIFWFFLPQVKKPTE